MLATLHACTSVSQMFTNAMQGPDDSDPRLQFEKSTIYHTLNINDIYPILYFYQLVQKLLSFDANCIVDVHLRPKTIQTVEQTLAKKVRD